MFLKKKINSSTEQYSEKIYKFKEYLNSCDAVLIGAGAGLSTAAGHSYSGERFEKNFSDFIDKYGLQDMYSSAFYPFKTPEESWAYWSRHIYINRYKNPVNELYAKLFNLIKDKNYFVITTNADHLFLSNGFDKQKVFYTQGDYGLWQCSVPCHNKTYNNEDTVIKMVNQQKDMKIPSELIPYCPVCGKSMKMNLRMDNTFVEDEGWHKASERYHNYIKDNKNKKVLFLELGIGQNTPSIIKYPFWQMTYCNKQALYTCVNFSEAECPKEIQSQSLLFNDDIVNFIANL